MIKTIRILTLLIAVALFTILFAGCSNSRDTVSQKPVTSSSSDTAKPTTSQADKTVPAASNAIVLPAAEKSSPLKFYYKVYSEAIKDDDGSDLASFKISYPYIDNPDNDKGVAAINKYYEIQFDSFVANVIPEGKKAAIGGKKAAKEAGFPFYPFAFEKEAGIYYNGNNLLSVLHLGYENTGGAHPSGYWASETFDVKTGKKLSLTDIFGVSREKVLKMVYEIVLTQIEKAKGTNDFYYYETYKEDVKKNYSEEDFVLGHDGIVFYYQPYSIAPYAAGVPTFKLPYDKAGDLAVSIPPMKSNELEREAYLQAGRLIEFNKEVFYDIFGLSMLPLDIPQNKPEGQSVFPVKDSRFTTYSDFDNYIRSIYAKSEADTLMGSGRYVNKDGKLYGDMSKDAGMGYYVDWNNYRYQISDISETSATITIFTADDSPAGKEDKTIKVKMLKENGRWLLEKMFS